MTANTALSLPISRYSIEEAARVLGCEPAAILRMAGDGVLPVFIYLENLCGVAQLVASPVAVGDSVGDHVWRIRPGDGDCLIFQNLRHDAELFISRVPEGAASRWRDVWVTLGGFWQVDADNLKELGGKEGAPVILSAWSDDCGGPVFVGGNLPSPANDNGLWVMAEDLRRLCPQPREVKPSAEPVSDQSTSSPTEQNRRSEALRDRHNEQRQWVINIARKAQEVRPEGCKSAVGWAATILDLEHSLLKDANPDERKLPAQSRLGRVISKAIKEGGLALTSTGWLGSD